MKIKKSKKVKPKKAKDEIEKSEEEIFIETVILRAELAVGEIHKKLQLSTSSFGFLRHVEGKSVTITLILGAVGDIYPGMLKKGQLSAKQIERKILPILEQMAGIERKKR